MPLRLRFLATAGALALVALLGAAPLAAQTTPSDTTGVRRVELTNGRTLVGRIIAETDDALTIEDADGLQTTVQRAQVASVEALLRGRFWRSDPNASRGFLAPTARAMPRGDVRLSSYFILPSVAFGVTDRVDLSFGASIPAFGAGILTANVKGQLYRSDGVALALGVSALVPYGDGASGVGGTFYGLATFGSETGAVTLGAGGVYGTDFEDADVANAAGLILGLERQLTNSVKLLSENYVLIADGVEGGLLLLGPRFFGDNLTADLGLIVAVGDGAELSPVPYIGFAYNIR